MADRKALIERLNDSARELYDGNSMSTLVDPIAVLLEAADELGAEKGVVLEEDLLNVAVKDGELVKSESHQLCACGCGVKIAVRPRYATPACRQRASRARRRE